MIDILKALSETNRLKIVELLTSGPLCVCEIEAKLEIPQNLVSHHLSVLKKARVINNCRCGKNNYYSLNKAALNEIAKQISKLGETSEDQNNRLGLCNLQKTPQDN
jgi:ArsR family transcriptional regulator, arsenate/arsenite/antimonite-responsive transcriptional repressor